MRKLALLVCACFMLSCSGERQPPDASETMDTGRTPESAGATDEGTSEPINAAERAALAAQSQFPQPVNAPELLSCEPMDGMTPHCGFQNPEDLVQIPGTDLLIVSEMGEFMADAPGELSLLNTTTGQRETLSINWSASDTNWGEPDCPAPDVAALSPHGIDLTTRDDGAVALLVVNHGKRESVEFFAVEATGDLTWRGCALPPEDPFINDVAARSDGGFYVTHMWNKSAGFEEVVAMLTGGQPTGWVWAWTPAAGFSRVAETDALMPNGLALNPDNTMLYVNVYFGNKTFAVNLETGQRVGEFALRQPDNVSVDASGTLWIASHQHEAISQACTQVTEGPCLLPFQVVSADADTFESNVEPNVVINHDGPPMGYATVALKVGNQLYLGTAHGDRVVSVQLEQGP